MVLYIYIYIRGLWWVLIPPYLQYSISFVNDKPCTYELSSSIFIRLIILILHSNKLVIIS